MGCLNSKKETSDPHSNVFRVVNINENGIDLCSGQLEITETDIILYREGRDSTVWPLHSLRRYGFESEIFSFESGRRCETGEGIYAFRCRRAPILFRTLQRQIQLRNVIHDSVPYPVSRLSPTPQGRQTLQASVIHRSSVDSGPPDMLRPVINNNLSSIVQNSMMLRNTNQAPRSPSSADILEVMPLYPRNQNTSNHASNVYQLRDFKRENNNNQGEAVIDTRHVYSNDLSRDLAILRNTLRQETALNTMRDIEDETRFLESRYIKENVSNQAKSPLSPTLSNSSEHYAQLSLEQQEASRLYVNITPDKNIGEVNGNEVPPAIPLTPKQIGTCNLTVTLKPDIINSYANLMLGELGNNLRNLKPASSVKAPLEDNQKTSESFMSPEEEIEVNYAELDIDANKECGKISRDVISPKSQSFSSSKNESVASCSSQTRCRIVSQCSVDKATTLNNTVPTTNIGYTTIDFDKTVALTSVADIRADKDADCNRKTRHNSCNIVCSNLTTTEKTKTN